MTDPAGKPLTVGITSYVTAYVQHWNQLFAASVIAIVPVVVLFALIERHLVGGLTAGSLEVARYYRRAEDAHARSRSDLHAGRQSW